MRSRNDSFLPLWLCIMAILSQPAFAKGTVGELSDVQAQTILAEAKVRLAEAQSKLLGAEPSSSAGNESTLPPRDISLPAPVVRTIYGSGGRMTATFLFPGGYEADAGAGQDLPGGYRVEAISMDKVMLSKGGKRFPVGFSSSPQNHSMPTVNSMSGMGAPALPGAAFPPNTFGQ